MTSSVDLGSGDRRLELGSFHSQSACANVSQTLSSTRQFNPRRRAISFPQALPTHFQPHHMSSTLHSAIDENSPDKHTHENECIPHLTSLIFRPSILRFHLPSTLPHEIEMASKSTLYREVGTKDLSSDVSKVNRYCVQVDKG